MEQPRGHHHTPGKEGTFDHIEMATISFGGAPGVYINEVAGQSATPAIAAFSTVYMLVEVDPEVPTTLFPFNEPVQVTNSREYVRLIGGVIPAGKIELLSYQCVDAFFTQSYVGDLRVIRVGTPINVVEVQFNPSGFKTNGLGVSSSLQAGDVVFAQLLINGARLGEFTSSGTWKGVPVEIPVDYVEGNYDNNKKIAIAIRDAVALAVTTDPNVAAGTIVRDRGVCKGQFAECAFEYLAGREFNAPVSVVPESEPPSDGAYYVFTLNAYTVGPVIPDNENTNELVSDYIQCLKTAFVDQEDQGYLTAPVAFAKFGPEERRLIGQEMARQAELNSHKWMAIADAGPYNVTDILEYNNFLQHEAAAPLKTNQEFLVGNTIYKWTADDTNYLQLRYTPLSGTESNPEFAVNGSQNLNVPVDRFLSLRDDGEIAFATSTTPDFDRPGLLDLQNASWPSTKEAGTPVVLSKCVGALAELDGETVYVVPTYLTPTEKTFTGYIYFAATYPQAITAYNWIIGKGGLNGDGTPQYPGVQTLPPGCIPVDTSSGSGLLGDAVTGVVITVPGSGYTVGDEPDVIFSAPAALGGRTATGYAVVGGTGGVTSVVITDAGSGYSQTDVPTVTFSGGTPTVPAQGYASLQTKGTGLLTYEVPAWDLNVEIDGQVSDLILNDTNELLDLNTLHLPGTLQNSTENFQLAQFSRKFAETDITKQNPSETNSPAVFGCLNHGLVNGSVIYFTAPLTKIGTGTLVNASTSAASVRYYVNVINGNQFRLATTLSNLNSRIFIQFPNNGLNVGQTTLSYSGLVVAPENTSLYNNEGVVNLIRGRKYGFNTYNVLPTFYPANLDPLSGPADVGQPHTLGFYRVENQPDAKYYSPFGEFDAGVPNPENAGFLGDLVLRSQNTVSYFCTPLTANDRSAQAYITPTFTDGSGNKTVLWGSSLTLRYIAYKEAPSNLWRFNAVTSEELVDYGLRGTFNEGVPAAVVVATGIDDAQKLLEDSQEYYNPRGFIAYYGPYLKNASGAWIPPSPYITGVAIRRYRSEGFQYPPAGVRYPLNGVSAVQIPINSIQQDILNPKGCNVCRTLPGYGNTVFIWGGRTRINQADAEQRLFQFVNTRVIMNVVYGSLRRAFDSQIFNVIDGFGLVYNKIISIGNSILNELYVRGALFGKRPGDAFQVICDERVQTKTGLESGLVRAKVFVVPVPTLERIEVDLIRVAIGNMQNELDALGVGQDNAI